jgi:ORF6N domain
MKDENSENLIVIEEKIFLIRGQRVMIDSDLAEFYQVATKVLNQAVKRNLHRFPEDFMFQLTEDETQSLRSQIVTSNERRGGRRTLPFVFTEHGAVMLASVLNSSKAIEASIQVVRAFVRLRAILTEHKELAQKIEILEKKFVVNDGNINKVFVHLNEIFKRLPQPDRADFKPMKKIGFVEKKKND